VCPGPDRIDECSITYRELHDPIVLNDRRSASNLKQDKVMIDTVEANIPLCPLDPMGVAT